MTITFLVFLIILSNFIFTIQQLHKVKKTGLSYDISLQSFYFNKCYFLHARTIITALYITIYKLQIKDHKQYFSYQGLLVWYHKISKHLLIFQQLCNIIINLLNSQYLQYSHRQMITSKKLILLQILVTLILCFAIDQVKQPVIKQSSADTCEFPLITQFIQNYQLPTADIQYFVAKNMSAFQLTSVGSSKSTLFQNINANVTYDGSNRQVKQMPNFEWNIVNDGLTIALSLKAKVSKTIGSNSYDIEIHSSKIPINYTKSFDKVAGSYAIKSSKIQVLSQQFNITKYTPNPSSSDKQKIVALMSSSLVAAIAKNFDTLNSELNSNAKSETVSEIYPQKNYNYRFYETQFGIDMISKVVQIGSDSTVINGLTGTIEGLSSQLCPQQLKQPFQNYTQFFSIEFIRNLAEAGIQKYDKWQNVPINSTWIRSQAFQFRLIDLQFIMDSNLFDSYGQYYMNQIYFTCGIKQIQSMFLDRQKPFIHAILTWACKGKITNITLDSSNSAQQITILDFQPQIDHQIYPRVDSRSIIAAYSDVLKMVDIKFKPVQDFKIVNQALARVYMEETFNDFRTYVFGTYFDVKKGSSKLKFEVDDENGSGIWVQ